MVDTTFLNAYIATDAELEAWITSVEDCCCVPLLNDEDARMPAGKVDNLGKVVYRPGCGGPALMKRPYISEIDELIIVLRKGTARRPLNQLEDRVAEATMMQCIATNDDLYTWENFKAMIENEYGYILDEAIANHPTDAYAALSEWLEGYSLAHNSPLINLDGWEGSGYPCPEGEPLIGLLPPEEPPE